MNPKLAANKYRDKSRSPRGAEESNQLIVNKWAK